MGDKNNKEEIKHNWNYNSSVKIWNEKKIKKKIELTKNEGIARGGAFEVAEREEGSKALGNG